MIHRMESKALTTASVTLATLTAAIVLAACAHRPPRVNCDGKLQPINQPAPIQEEDRRRTPDHPPTAATSSATPSRERGGQGPASVAESAVGDGSPDGKESSP
jgi:hypothetical protein